MRIFKSAWGKGAATRLAHALAGCCAGDRRPRSTAAAIASTTASLSSRLAQPSNAVGVPAVRWYGVEGDYNGGWPLLLGVWVVQLLVAASRSGKWAAWDQAIVLRLCVEAASGSLVAAGRA